jgi:hypothetical protein
MFKLIYIFIAGMLHKSSVLEQTHLASISAAINSIQNLIGC